jgi:Flp pilus assembly protein TadD
MLFFPLITLFFPTFALTKASIMALKDWMIAFNNAKTMESNGEEGPELIAEYERVLEKLGDGQLTEAEEHVRDEVCRNLNELYLLNGDEEKAQKYI